MEIQIVIFLAFTSVTLIFNSMVIWFAYKAFANVTTKVTETMRELQTSSTTRSWLSALQSASGQAVLVTGATKKQVALFGPVLEEAQSRFGYELARFDVRFERLCDNIRLHAESAQGAILRPAHSIGAAASGVSQVFQAMSGDENGFDASSRQK